VLSSDDAIKVADAVDEVDEYIQAAHKADALGDYVSADRLVREAEAIRQERLAGRRYLESSSRRAGTVSGVFEGSRIVGYRPAEIESSLDTRVTSTRPDMRSSGLFDSVFGEMAVGKSQDRDSELDDLRYRREAGSLFDFPDARESEIDRSREQTDAERDSRMRAGDMADAESRQLDERITESRMTEQRLSDFRGMDTREADSRLTDMRAPEIRSPETRMPDERVAESRLPEVRTPDVREPEVRTPEPRAPEVRRPDTREYEVPLPRTQRTPRMSDDQRAEYNRISNLKGVITWRQGAKWQVLPPPYRQEDMRYFDKPLPGTYKFATGRGSAHKTLQVIGGLPKQDIDVDLGWTKIHIDAKGKELQMTFGGGKEAAETRWTEEQTEMDALERESYEDLPDEPINERIKGTRRVSSEQSKTGFGLNKRLLPQYSTKDVKIYSVSGEHIRRIGSNSIGDRQAVDFTMGGHSGVYDKLIPEDEVWVEENMSPEDQEATILHELNERNDMLLHGKDYETAHDNSSEEEIKARQNPDYATDAILRELDEYKERVRQRTEIPQPKKDMRLKINRQPRNADAMRGRYYLGRKLRESPLGAI
jgi:hypothetical protein